jgi:RHS repeat-associated protein
VTDSVRLAATSLLLAGAVGLAPIKSPAQSPSNYFNYSRATSLTPYPSGSTWYGLVQSETIEPSNLALCTTTTYTYDSYGNRKSATVGNCTGTVPVSAQFASRTNTTYYTANTNPSVTLPTVTIGTTTLTQVAGAYPIAATNALGQMQTQSFDPRFGVAVSETGPNGLTTTWSVDDFGRRVLEARPDGTSTVTYYCYVRGSNTTSNSAGCPTPAAAEIPSDAQLFVHSEPHDKNNVKMGPYVRAYYDRLGRQIRQATESFDASSQPSATGGVIVQDTQYSQYGPKQLETQPYFLATKSSTTTGSGDAGLKWSQYDALGRLATVTVTDPNGSAGSVAFPASYAFPSGASRVAARTTFTYTGMSVTTTNDKSQTHSEDKDPFGHVVRATDATGATLIKYFDAFGNLVQTTDALGNSIVVTYDIRGNKLTMQDPDTGVWAYCYDALGQLWAQQSPNQRGSNTAAACPALSSAPSTTAPAVTGWTTMAYDQLGRMTQRSEPEYKTTWSYDQYANASACTAGKGKLCEVTTTSGLDRKVVYDSLGRPINTLQAVTGAPSFAAAVAYNSATGRLASQTYPTGLTVNFNYTAKGFLQSLTLPATGLTVTVSPLPATPGGTASNPTTLPANYALWTANAIDAWGKVEQQTYGNSVISRMAYDGATGRTTSLIAGIGTATNVANESFLWDSIGNLSTRTDYNGDGSLFPVAETSFLYDPLNRLTSYTVVASAGATVNRQETIQYNALGNVLYRSDVGVYTYPASGAGITQPHAVSQLSGGAVTTYHYDLQGNLTSASGGAYKSITYTSFNLPDSQSGVQGTVSTSYTWQYDENHARIKETRVSTAATTITASGPTGYTASGGQIAAGTRVTWYMHPDNAGGLGFEYECETSACTSSSSFSRHYLSAGGMVIGMLQSAGTSVTPSGTAPPTISTITLNKVEYWHADHLGSLIATTDHTGAVTARDSHDPFGKRRYANGAYDLNGVLIADYTTTTNSGTARGFTGHEELNDVGLINMNGRFYDPLLGRFAQADPFIQAANDLQSFNRYSYVRNNPLRSGDPSGLIEQIVVTPPADPVSALIDLSIIAVETFFDSLFGCLFGCDTPAPVIHVVNAPTGPTAPTVSNTQLTQPGQPTSGASGYGSNVSSTTIGGNNASAIGNAVNAAPSTGAATYLQGPGLVTEAEAQANYIVGTYSALPGVGPGLGPLAAAGAAAAGGATAASSPSATPSGQPAPESGGGQPVDTITVVGQRVSQACKLAEATAGGDSLLDTIGTGLSAIDAGGKAMQGLASSVARDARLGVKVVGEAVSHVAGPVGIGVGVAKVGTSLIAGEGGEALYGSVDLTVETVLATTGPVGVGVALTFDAVGGSKAVVHGFATGACMLGF